VFGEPLLYEGLGSVKPEVTLTCQACGTRIPAGLDFCPVCALIRAGGHDSAPSEALNPGSSSERNSAETEPASIVRRFENYEVMLDQDGKPIELGRGAMGITYKAFDIDLRFPVTLKVISEKYVGDESARLRFLREARAAAKVRRAMELRPISEDAVDGPFIAYYVAMVYALANQPDVALEQLNSLLKIPGGELNYGDLKTAPAWDPLRKDPRFDKLLAELAPRD
jgi:hypothetical protein